MSTANEASKVRNPVEIVIDQTRCMGSGQCVLTDSSIFDQGPEDGLVILLRPAPGEASRPAAEEAAELCPAGVIRVLG